MDGRMIRQKLLVSLLFLTAFVAVACSDDDASQDGPSSVSSSDVSQASVSGTSSSGALSSSASVSASASASVPAAEVSTTLTGSAGALPDGVTVTSAGTVYMTDIGSGDIYQITSEGAVTTVTTGSAGPIRPDGITVVTADGGDTLYVTETGTETLGTDEAVAAGGDGVVLAIDADTGSVVTVIDSSILDAPAGIAADKTGNLYIADQETGKILYATLNNGVFVSATQVTVSGLVAPHGLCLVEGKDGTVTLYITDIANDNVLKVEAPLSASPVTTMLTPSSSEGSNPAAAAFSNPHGITVNGNGSIFVADENGNRIAIITPSGQVLTFAGTGTAGDAGGSGATAQFDDPCGLALDAVGNVLVCDRGNGKIKKIRIL